MSINVPDTSESLSGPKQHFDGSISIVKIPNGTDTLEINMLDAKINAGDLVVINGEQPINPVFGQMYGETPFAELEMGGIPENGLPTQRLDIYKSGPDLSDHLKAVIENGLGMNPEKGFLISVSNLGSGDGMVEGFTFINPSTGFGLIGRKSNIPWVDGAGNPPKEDPKWTPFNQSISRQQLILTYVDGNLLVHGQSNNSDTRVLTRASAEQIALVKQAEKAKVEEAVAKAEQARKAQTIGKRVLRKVKKG